MSDWSRDWYPPSRPKPVEGGIKARSKRGAIGKSWWSQRFTDVLESIIQGGRLQRGRTYARQGQVIDLHVDSGAVTARVQGSRSRPYRVRVGITAFGKAEWAQVCQALADNAWYAAKLLAGEMPDDIEDVFSSIDLSLFPANARDLSMDCSCPDWEVPCKHLAAVFYLLAEAFDDDPFAILAWRGRDRAELLETLAALRTGAIPADHAETVDATVPLADCLETFFAMAGGITPHSPAHVPSDALLGQLPAIGITVRGAPLIDVLRPIYERLGDDV